MLLKYTDLHNKIFRDCIHPNKIAKELLEKNYYIIGVNAHNAGTEIKNKKHFYKFFETHFELFERKGLLMLPSVEIKIRDKNYSALPGFISHFSRKFIPIKYRGKTYHMPFMVFVHGGAKEANINAVNNKGTDMLCHPEKEEGYFNKKIARLALRNDVGFEINYREDNLSEDKTWHLKTLQKNLKIMEEEGNKIFLCSAAMREEELAHSEDLISFSNLLDKSLLKETIKNIHDLIQKKYGSLLKKTHYSFENYNMKHIHL
jgi:hypothetical protein